MATDDLKRALAEAKRWHRERLHKPSRIQPGDMVEVAGVPALVTYSEPQSDFVWYIEYQTCWRDGTEHIGSIKLPHDVPVYVRRKGREGVK